jgi:hypothetical protein
MSTESAWSCVAASESLVYEQPSVVRVKPVEWSRSALSVNCDFGTFVKQ